jgi:hypothetical protein
LKLSLARLYSDSVYYDRAREFNDPNFGFCRVVHQEKRINLTKLARMSRVTHNTKSIENRCDSFKIFTKWGSGQNVSNNFGHERPRHFEKVKQLINILFCGYRRLEIGNWRLPIQECCRNLYSPGAQSSAPASNNKYINIISNSLAYHCIKVKSSRTVEHVQSEPTVFAALASVIRQEIRGCNAYA